MLYTVIMVTFLLIGSFTLISASQRWGGIRDAQAAAGAAARAAVQVSESEARSTVVVDPGLAQQRANQVLAATGYSGTIEVSADGRSVIVTATGSVTYSFPSPLPSGVSGTASAVTSQGVLTGVGP